MLHEIIRIDQTGIRVLLRGLDATAARVLARCQAVRNPDALFSARPHLSSMRPSFMLAAGIIRGNAEFPQHTLKYRRDVLHGRNALFN